MQGPRDPRPRQAAPRTVPTRRRMQSGTCPPLPWTALGHRQRGKRPRFCRQNLLKVLHSGRERCWVVQEGTVQRLPAAVGSVASEGQGARPRAPRGRRVGAGRRRRPGDRPSLSQEGVNSEREPSRAASRRPGHGAPGGSRPLTAADGMGSVPLPASGWRPSRRAVTSR